MHIHVGLANTSRRACMHDDDVTGDPPNFVFVLFDTPVIMLVHVVTVQHLSMISFFLLKRCFLLVSIGHCQLLEQSLSKE